MQRAWHHFARGVALARAGKADEATAERKLLLTAIAAFPTRRSLEAPASRPHAACLDIATLVLDARIAAAGNDRDRSIKLWQQAVAAADPLPYDEPPIWFYPIRSRLARR